MQVKVVFTSVRKQESYTYFDTRHYSAHWM